MAGSLGFQANVARPRPKHQEPTVQVSPTHPHTDTVNIAQNYPNPIRLDLFPSQNMAGSPGLQVDIARPSNTIPINRNRQSRSGPPPK